MEGRSAGLSLARTNAAGVTAGDCTVCGGRMAVRKGWLARCTACGFLASNLPAGAGTGIEGLETLRQANFERILDRLAKHRPLAGARVLEVGCAKGLFLEAALRRGAEARGIEPELRNAEFARERGFKVEDGFFPNDLSDPGPYDVIVFNDVFEHLPNPAGMLRTVEALLAPAGIVVLNLPTSDGFLYKTATLLDRLGFGTAFDRLWQKGLPSPHVSYFNARNLGDLARRHTQLMPLDRMRLASVDRNGLYQRVKSVNRGPAGDVLFAGAWAFSYVAELLPSDIMALFLMRPRA